jgi:hypothetical protein
MAEIELVISSLLQIVPDAIQQSLPEDHVIARRERDVDPSLSWQLKRQKLLVPRARLSGVFVVTEAPIEHLPDLESINLADVKRDGTEALAWYRSYHFGLSQRWGIRIRQEGIYYAARYLQDRYHEYKSSSYTDLDALDFLQVAFNYLQLHEYFHFITDIACTVAELSQHKALYWHYLCEVYHQKDNKFEEAIANAYASRMMARQGVSEALKQFMLQMPPYYKEYGHWTGRRAFQYGRQKLGGLICPNLASTSGVVPGSELLFRIDHADLDYQDVPIYMERSKAAGRIMPPLRFVQEINHLEQVSKFDEEYASLSQSTQMRVEVVKHKLQEDVQDPSLHFEKIKGHGAVFASRVDRTYAISMRYCGGDTWELLRVGRSADIHANPW